MIVQHTNLDFQKQNFGAQVEMYFEFSVMHRGWDVVLKVLQCPSTWQDQGLLTSHLKLKFYGQMRQSAGAADSGNST